MDNDKRQERVSQAAQTALNLSHGVKNILQAIRGGRDVVDQSLKINDIERAKRGWEILGENLDKIEKMGLDPNGVPVKKHTTSRHTPHRMLAAWELARLLMLSRQTPLPRGVDRSLIERAWGPSCSVQLRRAIASAEFWS